MSWLACSAVAFVAAGAFPAYGVGGSPTQARGDAATLLAALRLPPGSRPSGHEPRGDRGALARPFLGPPDTPNAIDDHAWWVLPGSPTASLRYLDRHPPQGSRLGLEGMSRSGVRPTVFALGFIWPAEPGLSLRQLVVEVVRLPSGRTGLRADGQVVWITPRPASERIPAGARLLRVTITRFGRRIRGPLAFSSRAVLQRVIALLDALPAAQPGVSACPNDTGTRVRLAFFRRAAGGTPFAVAVVDPTGCQGVRLSIDGRVRAPLAGSPTFLRRLGRALGLPLAR